MKTSGEIYDAVAQAFQDMRANGFTALMNPADCSSCSIAVMNPKAKKQGKVKGVFFHTQDKECFEEGGDLSIRFGLIWPKEWDGYITSEFEEFCVRGIGWQVCEHLISKGLTVEWNSHPWTVIEVLNQKVKSNEN